MMLEQNELMDELIHFIQNEKDQDQKVIAYFGHEFCPSELIRAAGAIPLPLIFKGTEEKTAIGSSYLTPSMCPFALSHLGSFENREKDPKDRIYKLIDGMIATTYCTADSLVNEWIKDRFNIPIFNFYVPYLQRDVHIELYRAQLQSLYGSLCGFTGNESDTSRILEEIEKTSTFNLNVNKILSLKIAAEQKLNIMHKATLFGPAWDVDPNLYNDNSINSDSSEIPVLLMGASVFFGDLLYEYIEESGGSVACDTTSLAQPFQNIDDITSNLDDPFNFFVDEFKRKNFSFHVSKDNHQLDTVINNIWKNAQQHKVKGIINHILKFCDITGHHRQYVKQQLTKMGLPVLNLERDYSTGMRGQIRTRIEAFIEMIS